MEIHDLHLSNSLKHWRTTRLRTTQDGSESYDLTNHDVYVDHSFAIKSIGDELLREEGKQFVIDDHNRKVIRFLLYYFHHCPLAMDVFPQEEYTLGKNILLVGAPGSGKTLIMQVFAEYLKRVNNRLSFRNIGATELLNYQKSFGHINLFTYNLSGEKTFDGKPVHLCLNDLGFDAQNQKSFGTDLNTVIDEFLYARYEIWANRGIRYHLTSNLNTQQFKQKFDARLVDRLKAFNMIVLPGVSRR